VDSIAFHFRQDFENMAKRTRMLNGLAQDLLAVAVEFEMAVWDFLWLALRPLSPVSVLFLRAGRSDQPDDDARQWCGAGSGRKDAPDSSSGY
jgi:hypothetical protein